MLARLHLLCIELLFSGESTTDAGSPPFIQSLNNLVHMVADGLQSS